MWRGRRLLAAIKGHEDARRWSLAFTHTRPEFWGELSPVVCEVLMPEGISLVTDHFALLKGSSMLNTQSDGDVVDVTQQPGFREILELVRAGHLYIKLSAPYRVSNLAPGYEDLKPLVRAFVDANPERVLWGSDWYVFHLSFWKGFVLTEKAPYAAYESADA